MHKTYSLDGQSSSTLDWSQQIELAKNESQHILWHLDLGLFDRLARPLSDEVQLQTLQLALKHFLESCWAPFQEKSLGIMLYHGSIDFSAVLPRDSILTKDFKIWKEGRQYNEQTLHRLHAREVAAHYLETLAAPILWDVPIYLAFDASPAQNEVEKIEWLHPDFFGQYELAFFSDDESLVLLDRDSTVAICLPSADRFDLGRKEVDVFVQKLNGTKYRLISEASLEQEWDGVDDLYVPTCCLESDQTARKLQGFQVTGGRIVNSESEFSFEK